MEQLEQVRTDWQPTADTLHMWTQIVGKTRLALSPMQAHWWNVPLYVTARGLGTWQIFDRRRRKFQRHVAEQIVFSHCRLRHVTKRVINMAMKIRQ